jgi:hypothetical protein
MTSSAAMLISLPCIFGAGIKTMSQRQQPLTLPSVCVMKVLFLKMMPGIPFMAIACKVGHHLDQSPFL